MKKGFTLVEILVAVLIMGVLVTMAVPMYEKAIEKSRVAEARAMLKRLYEAKRRVLDTRDADEDYSPDMFGFEHLDFVIACTHGAGTGGANNYQITCSTKDFTYSLDPTDNPNAVCAARRGGDYHGVNFLYQGNEVRGSTPKFLCNNGNNAQVADPCDVYGMNDTPAANVWCHP